MNNTYIIPLYVPTERREKVVRLFFLKDMDEGGIVSRYCVVKDMSRLVIYNFPGQQEEGKEVRV